jgi:two-component system NtrC family response regulator
MELQVKLLRLVQQGEIEKVGATQPASVDVRIAAATHRDLKAMIEDGTFREDLYYRLAVIPLVLPPLRERAEHIPVWFSTSSFAQRTK